jgi:O-acetyl-ADP-ribose deacetylase (regulator of RNase III)
MISEVQGDLLGSDAEALVCPVNCAGVMGAGLALKFRHAHPFFHLAYKAACRAGEVRPGLMFVHELGPAISARFIIGFPTKRHWRDPSRLADVEAGLRALRQVIGDRQVRSVAVPALGCGLGGLDWVQVRPAIIATLGDLTGVQVTVYLPGGRG